jgi:hypothetical protein
MFTGSSGSRPVVDALCHRHAEATAVRIGHDWPLPKPSRENWAVRTPIMRAS